MKKILQKLKLYLIISTILMLLSPVLALGLFYAYFQDKIFPNVYINSNAIGGLTRASAKTLIEKEIPDTLKRLELIVDDQVFYMDLETIDMEVDVDKTIENAYRYGRDQDSFGNLKTQLALIGDEHLLRLEVDYNKEALQLFLASISTEINEPTIPPTISIVEETGSKIASVSSGTPGRKLDVMKASKTILEAIKSQSLLPIYLPLDESSQRALSDQEKIGIQQLAQHLIDKTMFLTFEDNVWQLSDAELINFLSPYDTFDEIKIKTWTEQLAGAVNRQADSALFQFDGEKVTEFKPANKGAALKVDETVTAIITGIEMLAEQKGDSEHTISLAVEETDPEITTEQVNDLGIKELIGKGESWFPHSIPGRIHNIKLSSSQFHGVLIAPGETFSFVEIIGEIDAQHGYQSAYIIKEGRTVLGDGGGVCQTSTTLFRAALDAGLAIEERSAHAYRVSYYEHSSDPGIDATIFSPTVDFKFENDTSAYILIQAIFNPAQDYLAFEIYGSDDGRVVTMTKPVIWDQTPPPPDRYQDDPTLPSGTIKQVDWKAWGAKVSFDWKVTRDGEVLHEETFYSNYRPWQAVYLRGTG